jgi:argininosuccinate lyase
VLKAGEVRALARALRDIGRETPPSGGHEDVHSFVEARLARRVGALAGKLHTGRSRNDQVAVDLRLHLRKAFAEAQAGALAIAEALARRAAEAALMPGYTHGRRAEPITFGHWCLAYVEMLLRDAARLGAAAALSDECPLGAGALSGSPVPIDRRALAKSLGFARPAATRSRGFRRGRGHFTRELCSFRTSCPPRTSSSRPTSSPSFAAGPARHRLYGSHKKNPTSGFSAAAAERPATR